MADADGKPMMIRRRVRVRVRKTKKKEVDQSEPQNVKRSNYEDSINSSRFTLMTSATQSETPRPSHQEILKSTKTPSAYLFATKGPYKNREPSADDLIQDPAGDSYNPGQKIIYQHHTPKPRHNEKELILQLRKQHFERIKWESLDTNERIEYLRTKYKKDDWVHGDPETERSAAGAEYQKRMSFPLNRSGGSVVRKARIVKIKKKKLVSGSAEPYQYTVRIIHPEALTGVYVPVESQSDASDTEKGSIRFYEPAKESPRARNAEDSQTTTSGSLATYTPLAPHDEEHSYKQLEQMRRYGDKKSSESTPKPSDTDKTELERQSGRYSTEREVILDYDFDKKQEAAGSRPRVASVGSQVEDADLEMSGPGRASPPKKTSVPHGSGSTPDNRSSPAASIQPQPSAAKDEIQTRAELEVKRSNEFGGALSVQATRQFGVLDEEKAGASVDQDPPGPGIWGELERLEDRQPHCAQVPDLERYDETKDGKEYRTGSPRPSSGSIHSEAPAKDRDELTEDIIDDMIRELKHDRDSQSKLLTSKQEEQEQQPPEESESVSLPEAVTEPTTEMKTEPITEPISIKQEITSDIFLDSETSPVPATDPTATFPTEEPSIRPEKEETATTNLSNIENAPEDESFRCDTTVVTDTDLGHPRPHSYMSHTTQETETKQKPEQVLGDLTETVESGAERRSVEDEHKSEEKLLSEESGAQEKRPSSEVSAQDETPSSEVGAQDKRQSSEKRPPSEAGAQENRPSSEVGAQEKTPSSFVGAQDKKSSSEIGSQDKKPSSGVGAQEKRPSGQSNNESDEPVEREVIEASIDQPAGVIFSNEENVSDGASQRTADVTEGQSDDAKTEFNTAPGTPWRDKSLAVTDEHAGSDEATRNSINTVATDGGSTKPPISESAPTDKQQSEPPQSEPPQSEPPQSEPPQSEPPQSEPPQSEHSDDNQPPVADSDSKKVSLSDEQGNLSNKSDQGEQEKISENASASDKGDNDLQPPVTTDFKSAQDLGPPEISAGNFMSTEQIGQAEQDHTSRSPDQFKSMPDIQQRELSPDGFTSAEDVTGSTPAASNKSSVQDEKKTTDLLQDTLGEARPDLFESTTDNSSAGGVQP